MRDESPRTKLAVIFGGRSPEHGVSCLSAAGILAHVDRERFDVMSIGIMPDGSWCAASDDPDQWRRQGDQLPVVRGVVAPSAELLAGVDVAFPVLHGRFGEDGTVQGLLEMFGIAYVGSGVLSSAICVDKAMTKTVLKADNVAVGEWVAASGSQWDRDRRRIEVEIAQLGFPIFVKPARAGSSVGISKIDEGAQLAEAIELALLHDSKFIVEAAVQGAREIEVGVISTDDGPPRASVPAEIVVASGHAFYDYEAKYLDGSSTVEIPADLEPAVAKSIAETAVFVFEALGCSGLARVDFFVTDDGRAVVNEVNTMPGFTPTSGFPKMWEASGLGYRELVAHLLGQSMATESVRSARPGK